MARTFKAYDVQIKVGGEWIWAGVAPAGMRRGLAIQLLAKVRRHPYWTEQAKATEFRIHEVKE